jgi:hypothetical protein
MVLADVGLGEILWSLLVIFFMVMYFMVLFYVILDLFRDHELGGVAKALWVVLLLFLPLISLLVYLITRGEGMGARSLAEAKATGADLQAFVRQTASSGGPAEQIAQGKTLLDNGTISAEEFAVLKQKALS